MFHRQKSYRIRATPERSSALPLCQQCDNVMQPWTPFLMSPCRQLSDTTTQLPICSTPRPADPTPHVGLPLVLVGTQSTRTPNPAQEIPALPGTAVKPTRAGSQATFRHIFRSLARSPSKGSLWQSRLFHTLLMLGWDHRSGHPNQILDEGVRHTPKGLGQTLATLSCPLSPPPRLSHPRIIIFGWITWELFADVVMI